MKLVYLLPAAVLLLANSSAEANENVVSTSLQFCALAAEGNMISTKTHDKASVGDILEFSYREKDVVAYKYEVCAEYHGKYIQLGSGSETVGSGAVPLRMKSNLFEVRVPPESSLRNQSPKPCEIKEEITCETIVGSLLMDVQYHLDKRSDGSRASRGLTYGDPTPTQPPTSNPACDLCQNWYDEETADTSWIDELPNCPCSVTTNTALPCTVRPTGSTFWTGTKNGVNWDSDPAANPCLNLGFHENANCIRADGPNGTGQQCCYDSQTNQIIPHGDQRAGTPDKGTGFSDHQENDVQPYGWCCEDCPELCHLYVGSTDGTPGARSDPRMTSEGCDP